ncbi:MAG TPA: two-component sensor histidine kinase, partial [Kiloniellales bacterium]|nr:two-component sensor histidine kinase [Kiloniellales bacterium]
MRLTRFLRTSSFRYALVYMALFGVSVSGVLAFVYYTTVGVIVRQTDETIQTEIQSLAEYYADNGLPGL